MKRRTFLGSLVASGLAACTSSSDVTAVETTTPTSASDTSVSPPSSTTEQSSTTTEVQSVDPIDAPAVDVDDKVFGLGIASGDPDSTSVVLWTRLVGSLPPTVPVVWELSNNDAFSDLLATGLVDVDGSTGHALHVLATGLQPKTRYWYRFRAGDKVSAAGRTRTLPPSGDPAPVRLAVSSCQASTDGEYAAHADIAAADVDVVLWLGDYIYGEASSLEQFRRIYGEYRLDPHLQACHAAHPWVMISDDHEVKNDYDSFVDPAQRAAAYRAWWENQPTRLPEPTNESPGLTFYRSIDIGSTARLILTDSRQYADGTTLFGAEQLSFIESSLQHGQRWTVLASSVLASGVRATADLVLPYTLDGYPAERASLAGWLAEAPDPLIVSGDLHTGMVLDFSANPEDETAPVVATELMAPAISSAFPADYAAFAPFLPLVNPHMSHVDVSNGWLRLELGPDGGTADFRTVDKVSDPESGVETTHTVALT